MAYFLVINGVIRKLNTEALPDAQARHSAACRENPRVTVSFYEGHPMLEKKRLIAQRPAPGSWLEPAGATV